jgi:DNA-binding response OmpR family regulator
MSTLTTWRAETPEKRALPTAPPEGAAAPEAAVVLIVEDEPDVAALLEAALAPSGYEVRHADGAAAALRAVEEHRPDAILLDLGLPDTDGLVLLHDLKSRAHVPILVCSARPRDPNAVLSLRLGAEDFIAKPFLVDELEERVAGALRRAAERKGPAADTRAGDATDRDSATAAIPTAPPAPIRAGALVVDQARCVMALGGVPLPLTPTEYRLLETLALRPDQTVSRDEIGSQIWGGYDAAIGKAIDVHVTRLRRKLAAAQAEPSVAVVAVRGFGFMLETAG